MGREVRHGKQMHEGHFYRNMFITLYLEVCTPTPPAQAQQSLYIPKISLYCDLCNNECVLSFQQALLDSTWGTCNTERLEKALCLERQQSGAETLVKRYLLADQQLTTMFDTSTIYETRKEIGNARRHTHRLCTHTTLEQEGCTTCLYVHEDN